MNNKKLGPGKNRNEIEDLILWEMQIIAGKGFMSLNDIRLRYNIEDDLEEAVRNLGAEGLIRYKEESDNYLLQITTNGALYVEQTLSIYREEEAINIDIIKKSIQTKFKEHDFIIDDIKNKEGYLITFSRQGVITDNYFKFERNRFLFFSILSNPKITPFSRFKLEDLYNAFEQWIQILSRDETKQEQRIQKGKTKIIKEASNSNDRKIYQTSLQHDHSAEEDYLNRAPFVRALADYIQRLWKEQTNNSYSININGEWGSGKSTILDFLERELKEKDWLVLRYNAWENQHLQSPWWLFLNHIFSQIYKKLSGYQKFKFWLIHYWWKIVIINKLKWLSAIFFIASLMILKSLSDFKLLPDSLSQNIEVVLAVAGVIWTFFVSISSKLLPGANETSEIFHKSINDPISLLKEHFQKLAAFPKRNIAVFIDDIDRCSASNTVKLLEGIQTIFKSNKILYVFSGDKLWVRQCFEIEYKDFINTNTRPGQSLGNSFVDKIFQMSIDVPIPSQSVIKKFLEKTLTGSFRGVKGYKDEIKRQFAQARTEDDIGQLLEKYRNTESEQESIEAAIDKISASDTQKEIKHELEEYFHILPYNPRSIKRLINDYSILRQSLIIQGITYNEISTEALVRWLVMKSKFPTLAEFLVSNPHEIEEPKNKDFKIITESKEYQELVSSHLTAQLISRITR